MPSLPTAPRFPDLAAHLARRGLSHAWLAQAVGVSSGHIGHVIRGRAVPSADLRHRIADVVGVPEVVLFSEEAA